MSSYCSGCVQLRAHLTDSCSLREVTDALSVFCYLYLKCVSFQNPLVVHMTLEPTQSSRYIDKATGWAVRGSNPGRDKIFVCFFLPNAQTSSGAHSASCSIGTVYLSRGNPLGCG